MSNSNLVTHVNISPNSSNPRNDTIKKITIHHMAATWTVERCGEAFAAKERHASANYAVDPYNTAMYVEEHNRAWTTGSPANDNQAITIEVANDEMGGQWHVADATIERLIDLCVDICQRNGIKELNYTGDTSGNLTIHKWFQPTACPGEYLESKIPEIAARVNAALKGEEFTGVATEPVQPETPAPVTVPDVEPDVIVSVNIGGNDQWLGRMYGHNSDINNEATGYAGKGTRTIEGVCIETENANFSVRYSVHTLKEKRVLGVIDSKNADRNNEATGFAGILGQEIDGITMFLDGTDEYDIEYQAKLKNGKVLGKIRGCNSNWYDYNNGYSGIFGNAISGITARIIKK